MIVHLIEIKFKISQSRPLPSEQGVRLPQKGQSGCRNEFQERGGTNIGGLNEESYYLSLSTLSFAPIKSSRTLSLRTS